MNRISLETIYESMQGFRLELSNQLKAIEQKVNGLSSRIDSLEKEVSSLKGRVQSETKELSFYEQGQKLLEQGDYGQAVEVFKKGLEAQNAKGNEKAKLLLALFKTLISLKREKEISSYRNQLDDLFDEATGPNEERVKAAILLCKNTPSDFIKNSISNSLSSSEGYKYFYFYNREKFDQFKGLLHWHAFENYYLPRYNESSDKGYTLNRLSEGGKFKPAPKLEIKYLLRSLGLIQDKEAQKQQIQRILGQLESSDLASWKMREEIKIHLNRKLAEMDSSKKEEKKSSWWG